MSNVFFKLLKNKSDISTRPTFTKINIAIIKINCVSYSESWIFPRNGLNL